MHTYIYKYVKKYMYMCIWITYIGNSMICYIDASNCSDLKINLNSFTMSDEPSLVNFGVFD